MQLYVTKYFYLCGSTESRSHHNTKLTLKSLDIACFFFSTKNFLHKFFRHGFVVKKILSKNQKVYVYM